MASWHINPSVDINFDINQPFCLDAIEVTVLLIIEKLYINSPRQCCGMRTRK